MSSATETIRESVMSFLAENGLSFEFQFQGIEQKKSTVDTRPSYWIQWEGKIVRGTSSISFPYGHGTGHLTERLQNVPDTIVALGRWKSHVENACKGGMFSPSAFRPDAVSAIHCLLSDCDVLNYGSFEQWADDFGMDTDSRSAEKNYKSCLKIALNLRSFLGVGTISALRDLMQDY